MSDDITKPIASDDDIENRNYTYASLVNRIEELLIERMELREIVEALRREHDAHAEAVSFLAAYADAGRGQSTPFDKAHYDEIVGRVNAAHDAANKLLSRTSGTGKYVERGRCEPRRI